MKNLKKLWPYIKKYKKYIWGQIIAGIIVCAIGILLPIISARVVSDLSKNILTDLLYAALVYFALDTLGSVGSYIAGRLDEKMYCHLITDIELSVVDSTFKLEKAEIDNHTSGLFIDRLTKDTNELSKVFGDLIYFLIHICENIGILIAVLCINVYAFVLLVVVMIVMFSVEKSKNDYWFKVDKSIREYDEENSGLISEIIRGMTDIKLLNVKNNLFKRLGGRLTESNLKVDNLSKGLRKYILLSNILKHLYDMLLIVLGLILIGLKKLTADKLLILYMYKDKALTLLDNISMVMEMMKKFNLSAERIFEISDGTFKQEIFGNTKLDKVNGLFEFKNVYFSYDKKVSVIKDMSFKINPNETVAFVGKSGSGKSTVFSLLDKLYNVDSGKILIDNHDINDLTLDSIRNNISVINQSPYIFNFSIKDNLKLVKDNASDDEIVDVCKKAQIHDYIMTLPNKYDTVLGESGVILSGGQKQRLAIARALLKGTEIILFDEATSALDNETQEEIQKAINNMKGKQTILIIAHRLSTVVDSDRILLVDDGKIIGEGTHKSLLANNDIYKHLYQKELK